MVFQPPRCPDVAVVGVSALFPDSVGKGGFWRNILEGNDLITDVPPSHWLIEDYFDPDPGDADKTYCKRGGFLPEVDFDPVAFGIPPKVIPATDTTQLIALIVARQVLEDAFAEQFDTMDRERMSIILGVTAGQELLIQAAARLQRPQWLAALRQEGIPEDKAQVICDRIAEKYTPWQENTFPGLLGNVVAGRIANRFDLGGTNCITDAACASSLSALSMGLQELYLGTSDVVITGGVDCFNDIFMYMCFTKTPALSRSGDCRPFADGADGTLMGEGLGMFALKRLEDAERDGDQVYAVVKGIGSASDGRSLSVYAPLPEGQARALRRAHEQAGVGPETIELVEAHGTGTRAGDVAEFEGLRLAFGDTDTDIDEAWCALGSVKSQIGHTKAAAGAAGLFKVVMALLHKVLPPTIKVEEPSNRLPLDKSPFYINTASRPWIRGAEHPRRAGLSSFGFGGSNFHVVLEEYQGPHRPQRIRALPAELFCLSDDEIASLHGQIVALRDQQNRVPERSEDQRELLATLARTSQESFRADASFRLTFVAQSLSDLFEQCRTLGDRLLSEGDAPPEFETPAGAVFRHNTRHTGQLAGLFPGQGSQYVEMGMDLAIHFDAARRVWDQASDRHPGLARKVFPPPVFDDLARGAQQEELTRTEWAQPAIGVDSAAKWSLLQALGLSVDLVAGHSFGEVTALMASGVLDVDAMVDVARRRGELMAEAAASTSGAMTAVRASAAELREMLEECEAAVEIANDNGPRQVVISGPTEAVEAAEAFLEERLVAFTRLPVATAFHSPVVADATVPFAEFLGGVKLGAPTVPIYANVTAQPHGLTPKEIRETLTRQIESPVRFVESIEAMVEEGATTFLEIGPGSVLSNLVRQILRGKEVEIVSLDRRGQDGVLSLLKGLGHLAALGVELSFDALWDGYADPIDPREIPRSKFTVRLNGANFDRPYPPPSPDDLPPPNPPAPASLPSRASQTPASQTPAMQTAAPNPTPKPSPRTPMSDDKATAFAAYQRALAESHMAYLKLMEESVAQAQMAYMRAMENSFAHWCGAEPSATTTDVPRVAQPAPQPAPQRPAQAARPQPPQPPIPAPPPSPTIPSPAPRAVTPVSPSKTPANGVPSVDLPAVMLTVVADKTGYPVEMLEPSMGLEADLGIDSIKRVEILSAVQEEVSDLPDLDPGELAALRTLGEITNHLQQLLGAAPATPATPAPANETPKVNGQPSDLQAVLMTVVAEKTGYPEEMLEPSMALEADLGIDSIKRVEILSALQDQVPDLPETDPGDMAALKTLGEIVGYFSDADGGGQRLGKPEPSAVSVAPTRAVAVLIDAPSAGWNLLTPSAITILADQQGVAEELQGLLSQAGYSTQICDELAGPASQLIDLRGLDRPAERADALEFQRRAFSTARTLAAGRPETYLVAWDGGGVLGVTSHPECDISPWLGGFSALAKTAAREWEFASVRGVDIDTGSTTPEVVARRLLKELTDAGPEIEIGIDAAGVRRTICTKTRPLEDSTSPFVGDDDILVATGGARGVTASCLVALARRAKPTMILLGRTALNGEPPETRGAVDDAGIKRALLERAKATGESLSPAELGRQATQILREREVRDTLEAIEATGAVARYLVADVRDRDSLHSAIETVRQDHGAPTILVHAAGVLADRRIADKTDEQFRFVFDTKVDGLSSLLEVTEDDPLRGLVVFSSVAARTGNPGQVDYAMANETLNKVVTAWADEPNRRGVSLNWGPWDGGMVDESLRKHFAARGVSLIDLQGGAEAFCDEVLSPDGPTEIVLGDDLPTMTGGRTLISLGPRSHPELRGHSIDGRVVVPAAFALHTLTALARTAHRDRHLQSVDDFKVLSGIVLDDFEDLDVGVRFALVATPDVDGRVRLELQDLDGAVHYRATATYGDVAPRVEPIHEPEQFSTPRWDADSAYRDVLFHRDAFQVMETLDGVGDDFARAMLREASSSVILDTGLQLALLQGVARDGRTNLPTGLARFVDLGIDEAPGPLHLVAQTREVTRHKTVTDVDFRDATGSTRAAIRGLEMFFRGDVLV